MPPTIEEPGSPAASPLESPLTLHLPSTSWKAVGDAGNSPPGQSSESIYCALCPRNSAVSGALLVMHVTLCLCAS